MTSASPPAVLNSPSTPPDVLARLVEARAAGKTLRQCAALVGVHVATVCRWQARDPELRELLHAAAREWWRRHHAARPAPAGAGALLLAVQVHPRCPWCSCAAEVAHTASGRLVYWQCVRWPSCRWRSWRPRYPLDCPACQAWRFYAHDRRSVGCPGCGRREPVDPSFLPPTPPLTSPP
jgi:hypothetical protein